MKFANQAALVTWLLLAANLTLCADPPTTASSAKDRQAQAMVFFDRITVADYDRIGRTDPKWDADAKEALGAMARIMALEYKPTGDEPDVIWYAVKRARAAGCPDPLLRYCQARNYWFFDRRFAETAPLHFEAADLLASSDYHALFKCYALLRAAEQKTLAKQDVDASKLEAARMLDAAMMHLPLIVADADVPRHALLILFDEIGSVSRAATGSRETYAARAFEILDKASKDRSMVLAIMADFYTNFAWDARGGGFADDITPEEAGGMAQRLKQAETAAEAAWELDNGNVFAAREMMTVELGQGQGRPRLEQWFARAMKADPDNYFACESKRNYLEPKWYGSVEEMLAFGRECHRGGNVAAGLPLILIEAHVQASRYGRTDYHREPQHAYFKDPKIWAEIREVYDNHLRHYPTSLYHRSRYATLACWAEDWKTADEQFRAMGKRFSYGYFRNDARYRKQLAEVRKHVPESTTPPATN